MGTRADFYVGRGESAEWLGSVAMDGYPSGINYAEGAHDDGSESPVLTATDETVYRAEVARFIASRRDGTVPTRGWPWPWQDSRTTDYAYAFDGGAVWGSCFGHAWFKASEQEPDDDEGEKVAVFPTMDTGTAALSGARSGLIVITPRGVIA